MPKKAGMEKWKKKRHQEYLEAKEYQYGGETKPIVYCVFCRSSV